MSSRIGRAHVYVLDICKQRKMRHNSDKVAGYMHAGGRYYGKNKKEDFASKTIFHHKNRSYRISLEAEEITEPKSKKDGAE